MGYKTIQKHREELDEKLKAYEALLGSAKTLAAQWEKVDKVQQKVQAEFDKVFVVMEKMVKDMEKLDTKGIAEFEDYRKKLLSVGRSEIAHTDAINSDATLPMLRAVTKMRAEVAAEHRKWIEKLAAAMPAELKPGMVLIDKSIGNVYEVKNGPYPAKNVNLTGDDAIIYDIICYRDGKKSEFPMKKSELKKNGMKFVRS